uniref:Uncharacterized protein n=1 Tax=Acrobeloides nanus TaxID=290746 RepID=A0A914BZK9_9BILA
MSHRRKQSFESEVFDEMAHQGINMYTETKLPLMSPSPMDRRFSQLNGNVPTTPNSTTGKRLSTINRTSEDGAIDCIIYSQYDTVSNSNASSIGAERSPTSPWEHHPSALRPNSLSAAKSPSPNPRVFQNAILNTQIRPLIHMNSSPQTIQVQPQLHYIQQKPPTPTHTNHTSKHIPPSRLARPSMPSCRPSVWTPRNPVVPSASLPVINKMSEVIERPTVGAHALPECRCNLGVRDYGSTHDTRVAKRMANLYQGETFVLNDRSFFI